MIQFRENAQTDGRMKGGKDIRTDRPCFIGTFHLLLGVEKSAIDTPYSYMS